MSGTYLLALTALTLVPGAPVRSTKATAVASVKAAGDHVDFLVGTDLVGRYHIGRDVAKPYFWPLNDPYGQPITRGWPMVAAGQGGSKDHPHQKSAWFCHGDVIPEGLDIKHQIKGIKGVDFWSEARGHGTIVCTQVRAGSQAPTKENAPRVFTRNEWRTADGVKILDEIRTLRLYTFGTSRLLVFDIDLHASVVPITFGDTKEGSFGVRVNDALREKGGKGRLVNADGKTGMKECWGVHAAWCDYSGPIAGKVVGITIFDHPGNPAPACWHSRDYGLMAANPFGRARSGFPAEKGKTDLVKLAKGQHLKLRYGLLIHPGDVEVGKVAALYQKYLQLK